MWHVEERQHRQCFRRKVGTALGLATGPPTPWDHGVRSFIGGGCRNVIEILTLTRPRAPDRSRRLPAGAMDIDGHIQSLQLLPSFQKPCEAAQITCSESYAIAFLLLYRQLDLCYYR
jgi:hypothetical protein